MDDFLRAAMEEARKGLSKGGIPIGSVLVIDGKIAGRGHNQRVQQGSVIRHAEMDCLENAGRLQPSDYRRSTLYSTLSPCDMCSGAVLLYKIPRVVRIEHLKARKTTFLRAALTSKWLIALSVWTSCNSLSGSIQLFGTRTSESWTLNRIPRYFPGYPGGT